MSDHSSSNHAATAVIGIIILVVILWMYNITIDYNHSNELAEESYIAVKEDFIKIQVDRTIQTIDNHMIASQEIYKNELDQLAVAIKANDQDIKGYLNGNLSPQSLMDRYIVLNPYINYGIHDVSTKSLIYTTMDIEPEYLLSDKVLVKELILLDQNKELILFITEEGIIELVKAQIIPVIRDVRLQDSGYIWVNEVVDYNGGEAYAIRRIHSNLQDTEGVFLSTYTEDAYGNLPYQIELDGIKANGEITFEYYFKKKDSDVISRKMSYAKLYEPFDWIVATGVHLDDLDAYLTIEKMDRMKTYRAQLILAIVMLVTMVIFFIWRGRVSIELIKYRSQNLELTEELKIHTKELEETLVFLRAAEEELIATERRSLTTQLVAGVAHEINTPLGLSVTCASHITTKLDALIGEFNKGQLSKSDFLDYCDTLTETSELLESNLQRSIKLINNFKKVAVDMSTDERRAFELCDYVENLTGSLFNSLKNPGITWSLSYSETVMIDSYPGAIYQIMTNLLMNSINHGFKGRDKGHVEITISTEEESVMVHYHDDGNGIDAMNLESIFEPFFTTGKSGGNTGLGLYIVHSLVESTLGGKISCESLRDKGCTFTIVFPRTAPIIDDQ